MSASIARSIGNGYLRQVNGRLRTTFKKGTNPTAACDLGRAWSSRSRTQGAGLGGAKFKPEDAEMRGRAERASSRELVHLPSEIGAIVCVCHARHPGVRDRGVGPHVPDAPVSHFTLALDGGSKGLLENSPGLCSATQHVSFRMTCPNGKSANHNPVLKTPCSKKHKRKGHRASAALPNRRAGR
jgi:hypothetical protein